MKKITHLFCASLFLLVGCTEDVELEVNPLSAPFYASIEGATRTYADEDGQLLWTSNDKITLFKGNTLPLVYQFTGSTGDEQGGFIDISPAQNDFVNSYQLPANYAIYPYAEGTKITSLGVINYTIPATQTYAANSFGLDANVMVAVTENKDDRNLEFKNVGGYFEFSLYGEDITVDRIEFSGNNNEKLAGDVSITATHDGTPSVIFADDATTTLTLDCGEGVELSEDENNPTKFWFVVPAITYEDGISITITDTEGCVMRKSTSKSITIKRSTVQPLSTVDAEMAYIAPRNNEIWYTSTDGNVVTPYKTDVFGANIVSNVYENGKGVITFDGDVTSIGNSAFWGCLLESITIPDGVTSIGYNAFSYCTSLSSITLPDSVTSIGDWAFAICSSLESITIPDGVTSIGERAFANCTSLSSITLPDSVTSIGDGAFSICSSLTAFYGKYASADKRCLIVDGILNSVAHAGLTSYTIPSGVTSIGELAFADCTSLIGITIPNGVTSIGDQAFDGCSSLTSITLPDSVTSIGDRTFEGCSSLTSITLPDSVTSIGYMAFEGCSSLIVYGQYASADNRCWIVDGELKAFSPAGLTSYIIPDGVTSIGDNVFYGCASLTSITIPEGVTSIGDRAFFGCLSLENITIPEGVTSIGEYAFRLCNALESVTLPESVTSIGYEAFCECTSLESINIPSNVTEIEIGVFAWCSSLTSIIIPEGVTSIGDWAFAYCSSLESVTLPEGVTSIGYWAFSKCSLLTSITLPEGVTSIGDWAFYDCSSLTTVYSKQTTPPTTYNRTFESCTNLNKIYVPTASVDAYKAAAGWSEYADKIEGYTF